MALFTPISFFVPPNKQLEETKSREGEWMARGAREGESVSLTFVTLHVCLLLNTTATAYIASSSRHWSNSGNSRGAWETRRSARSVRGIGRFCKTEEQRAECWEHSRGGHLNPAHSLYGGWLTTRATEMLLWRHLLIKMLTDTFATEVQATWHLMMVKQ